MSFPHKGRIRLEAESYRRLRQQVLKRDGWRCQHCGSMRNLEVHHKQFRSLAGDDEETNLITLCMPCHRAVHEHQEAALLHIRNRDYRA